MTFSPTILTRYYIFTSTAANASDLPGAISVAVDGMITALILSLPTTSSSLAPHSFLV